jgi:brefeldin A-inhibited guanine nucleotide-exchange protein
MDGFKDHLKRELEIFVANIFVKILESENATFDHKTRVLEVFHIICTEPSALVELFINYDCDLDAIDLFRRIVDGIAKITKVILDYHSFFLYYYILLLIHHILLYF